MKVNNSGGNLWTFDEVWLLNNEGSMEQRVLFYSSLGANKWICSNPLQLPFINHNTLQSNSHKMLLSPFVYKELFSKQASNTGSRVAWISQIVRRNEGVYCVGLINLPVCSLETNPLDR